MAKLFLVFGFANEMSEVSELARQRDGDLQLVLCNYSDEPPRGENCWHWKLTLGTEFETIVTLSEGHQVRGILNRIDATQMLHGKLLDYFDLPGPRLHAMQRLTDKSAMHELMMELGLGFYRPRTQVSTLENLKKELKLIQFPVVVKPNLGAKSRGVFVLQSMEDFDEAWRYYQTYFETARILKANADMTPHVQIEQFVRGRQVAPVGYVDGNGKYQLLTMVDIYTARDEGQNHQQLVYRTTPSKNSEAVRQKIQMVIQKLCRATDLHSTQLHPEFIVRGNTVYLIEVNVRIAGFRVNMMKQAYDVDLIAMAVDLALGLPVNDDFGETKSVTVTEIWDERSGVVHEIEWPESKYLMSHLQQVPEGENYIAPPKGNKPLGRYMTVSDQNSLAKARRFREKMLIEIDAD